MFLGFWLDLLIVSLIYPLIEKSLNNQWLDLITVLLIYPLIE
jgi:hypothetical protein